MENNSNISETVANNKKSKISPEVIEQIKDKYMTLADGTDISFITDPYFRYLIHGLTLQQIRQHKQAYEATQEYYDLLKSNRNYIILSDDYLFPDTDSNIIWGYIIQVRYREDNARKYLYLDICIGDENPKTIRSELSKFSDPIRAGIIDKLGWKYNIDDLSFILTRIVYTNKKDENGKTYFSVINTFSIDPDEFMFDYLDKAYEMLIGE